VVDLQLFTEELTGVGGVEPMNLLILLPQVPLLLQRLIYWLVWGLWQARSAPHFLVAAVIVLVGLGVRNPHDNGDAGASVFQPSLFELRVGAEGVVEQVIIKVSVGGMAHHTLGV
jgi:hypothetical protein